MASLTGKGEGSGMPGSRENELRGEGYRNAKGGELHRVMGGKECVQF